MKGSALSQDQTKGGHTFELFVQGLNWEHNSCFMYVDAAVDETSKLSVNMSKTTKTGGQNVLGCTLRL